MKKLKYLLFASVVLMMTSCATTAKFPVSSTVPAAELTAKKKTDNHSNNTIEITARNLASADRLDPPKNNYSIWIVTDSNGTKNLGQLNVVNGKKSTLKTVTPFNVKEIFITVEDQGNLKYPAGIEISRTKFEN